MGWFDIAFSQPFIVILVLLIGLSIDYGLHVVMRYREARESSETAPSRAMAVAPGVSASHSSTSLRRPSSASSRTSRPRSGCSANSASSALSGSWPRCSRLRPARSGVESRTRRTARTSRDRPLETGHRNRERADQSPPGYGETLATKAPTSSSPSRSSSARRVRTGRQTSTLAFEQSDFLAEDPDDWLKDLPDPIAPGRTRRRERLTRSTVTSSDRTPQPRYSSGAT